jgi:hypothetical protein
MGGAPLGVSSYKYSIEIYRYVAAQRFSISKRRSKRLNCEAQNRQNKATIPTTLRFVVSIIRVIAEVISQSALYTFILLHRGVIRLGTS